MQYFVWSLTGHFSKLKNISEWHLRSHVYSHVIRMLLVIVAILYAVTYIIIINVLWTEGVSEINYFIELNTMDNWLFSMNSPHQTICVLTWRRILLRGILAWIPCQGADCIEGQLSNYHDWNSGGNPLPSEGCTPFGWSYQMTCSFSSKEICTRHLDVVPKSSTSYWPTANIS